MLAVKSKTLKPGPSTDIFSITKFTRELLNSAVLEQSVFKTILKFTSEV